VVPGTQFPTLGGCAAMNIHGKNNFQVGTIGDHIHEFELLCPDGRLVTCSRDENPELFHGAIGGFGMLGVFTTLTLRLKKVHSGNLRVTPITCANLGEMIQKIEDLHGRSDYLVGWLDGFARGARLGRGLIHQANYLAEGEDSDPAATYAESHQVLPDRFFGILPRSWMWTGLWFLLNKPGMRLVNAAKHHGGMRHARQGPFLQSLVAFSFLLDYVPNWKYAYRPGGLIQYQSFVPREAAEGVFTRLLEVAQRRGILPYLGVLKKHRPDPFCLSHAVDGYSLALDFPVRQGTRDAVWALAHELDPVVTEAGGRFYFAKDSTMTSATLQRAWPAQDLERFVALKLKMDPGLLLQNNLFRRLFRPLFEGAGAPFPS
jgi:FAD/FMN-containing dehydrogenase